MKDFVKISKYAGMREDLVQAGGGNSSVKISEDKMAIKASGYQMADISADSGYALVNPKIIRERFLGCEDLSAMTDEDSRKILEEAFIEGKRPSIETFLHAVSGKYTLHTHPIVVNVLTCRKDGMEILQKLFPGALAVAYATPGIELAKAYFKSYQESASKNGAKSEFDIVFLQNHGLVVSGESADEVITMTEKVTGKIEDYLKMDMISYHNATRLWKYFDDRIVWKVTDSNILRMYNETGGWEHTFCPDCVVFLGKKMLSLPDGFAREEIENHIRAFGMPVAIEFAGDLFIVAESVKKAMEIQSVMSFSAQVMEQNQNCECNMLGDDEQNFLLNWDAEKYRKMMK
jgi:rhamnose utilization protein RhaD (predicted bifunctional aldolase and dehydrogenase)